MEASAIEFAFFTGIVDDRPRRWGSGAADCRDQGSRSRMIALLVVLAAETLRVAKFYRNLAFLYFLLRSPHSENSVQVNVRGPSLLSPVFAYFLHCDRIQLLAPTVRFLSSRRFRPAENLSKGIYDGKLFDLSGRFAKIFYFFRFYTYL